MVIACCVLTINRASHDNFHRVSHNRLLFHFNWIAHRIEDFILFPSCIMLVCGVIFMVYGRCHLWAFYATNQSIEWGFELFLVIHSRVFFLLLLLLLWQLFCLLSMQLTVTHLRLSNTQADWEISKITLTPIDHIIGWINDSSSTEKYVLNTTTAIAYRDKQFN